MEMQYRELDLEVDFACVKFQQMFEDANEMIGENNFEGAWDLLLQIIKQNPGFGRAYNHVGWILQHKLDQFERAEENYKRAIELDPFYVSGHLNYAYLLFDMSRFDELKYHLDRALQVPNISKELFYNEYARMFEVQGNPSLARDFYYKAALTALDDATFLKYKESVLRCERKIELMRAAYPR